MNDRIPKSRFKPKALEYFRMVEKTGAPLIITDHGRPVLRIVRYEEDPEAAIRALRGSVLKYEGPTEPIAEEDWDAL